jgi:hypothetical protein
VTVVPKGCTAVVTLEGEDLVAEEGGKGVVVTGTAEIARIAMADTTAKSVLSFKTKGGDGFATVEEITGDAPVGKLSGKTIDLGDGGIRMTEAGYIASTRLRNVEGDIVMDGPGPAKGIAIVAGRLAGGADIRVASGLKSVTLIDWAGSALHAPWLSKLSVKGNKREGIPGDCNADVLLNGGPDAPKGLTLGGAKIAGGVASAVWNVAGATGTVTVGGTVEQSTIRCAGDVAGFTARAMVQSDFLCGIAAGVERHAAAAGDFAEEARLRSVKVTGLKPPKGQPAPRCFVDSNLSAYAIGTVSLVNIAPASGDAPFGLFALDAEDGRVKSVKHKDTEDRDANWAWSAARGIPFTPIDHWVIALI